MDSIKVGPPGTNYVSFAINIWYKPEDNSIHITAPKVDRQFHTTVKLDSTSERYHRSLARHLSRVLKNSGKWPEDVPLPDR